MKGVQILYSKFSLSLPPLPFQIPFGDAGRLARFPPLKPELVCVTGSDWSSSAADVVLSSAGWVAVTVARDKVS